MPRGGGVIAIDTSVFNASCNFNRKQKNASQKKWTKKVPKRITKLPVDLSYRHVFNPDLLNGNTYMKYYCIRFNLSLSLSLSLCKRN